MRVHVLCNVHNIMWKYIGAVVATTTAAAAAELALIRRVPPLHAPHQTTPGTDLLASDLIGKSLALKHLIRSIINHGHWMRVCVCTTRFESVLSGVRACISGLHYST